MPWRFVGRTQQIGALRAALHGSAPGPVVIAGESGMGRTSVLSLALRQVDPARYRVVQVRPSGTAPLAALRAAAPGSTPAGAPAEEVARALISQADGGRLIIVADDAHLMDDASMLALRALSRSGDAMLLASHPIRGAQPPRPDPTDCLAYERQVRTITLPPFTVAEVADFVRGFVNGPVRPAAAEALQAATGGNPRRLHRLLVEDTLARCMVARQGKWDFGETPVRALRSAMTDGVPELIAATRLAWQRLAIDRVDQLCKLALWCGADDQIASIWPLLLLLRGNPGEAMDFLDSLADSVIDEVPQLALLRAMTLAFGFGRLRAAAEYLLAVASRGVGVPGLHLAYRAWLLAVSGCAAEAAAALAAISRGNRETALFVHAARAAVARLGGHASETVFHLRRAVATAESCRDTCPWLWPYLKACLSDALIFAGRAREVNSAVASLTSALPAAVRAGIAAAEPDSGGYVALSLCSLIENAHRGQREDATVCIPA
jgi:hypothetical protein